MELLCPPSRGRGVRRWLRGAEPKAPHMIGRLEFPTVPVVGRTGLLKKTSAATLDELPYHFSLLFIFLASKSSIPPLGVPIEILRLRDVGSPVAWAAPCWGAWGIHPRNPRFPSLFVRFRKNVFV